MKPTTNLLLPVLLALCLPGLAAAQTEFKIATIAPEGSHWMDAMREGAERIGQQTEGRVRFRFFTGAIQGTDAQVRRKMRIGQLHGGAFTSGALRHFHRDAEVYSLPMLFNDHEEVRRVRTRLDDHIRDLIEDAGYVNFGFAGGGFAYLMSNRPIGGLDDMHGVKVWIPEGDEVARAATRALGISPVTLPLTDVLTGLQTQLIDTVMGPPVGAIVLQWHTAVSSITDVPIAYTYGMLIIDGKRFDRLAAADQAVVRSVMESVYRGFDERSVADDAKGMQALLDDGLNRIVVAEGEIEEWRRLINQSNREASRSGAFDPALLDRIDCILAAHRSGAGEAACP